MFYKFTGNEGRRALCVFISLVLVQLGLVVGLLVLGVKGKEEIGTETHGSVAYYIGAIVVGAVVSTCTVPCVLYMPRAQGPRHTDTITE